MADGPDSAARRESKLGIRLGDEIRTRRIDARMRKARCRPFHSWDCHIAKPFALDREKGDEPDQELRSRPRQKQIAWRGESPAPDPKGVAAASPASMTRRFRREAAGQFLAFSSLVPKPSELADRSSGGLGFGRGLHAARRSRSVLNVPFQRSIRAWMLLHAARSARSSFSGEPATRPSSSSCPIGP